MKTIATAFRITALIAFIIYLICLSTGVTNTNIKWFLVFLTTFSILTAIILQIGWTLANRSRSK